MNKLEKSLSSFFNTFSPTLELVDELIKRNTHAQEIMTLLCARLDVLASTAKSEDFPRKDAFISFVCDYGQNRDFFNKFSLGDLYHDFAYHRYLLKDGLLISGGRLFRYSRLDDAFIQFIDYSDIPLIDEYIMYMFDKIIHALSSSFRVKPGQVLLKRHLASVDDVLDSISNILQKSYLKKDRDTIIKALNPLVDTKKIARVLYERFRSEAIHGGYVLIDEKRFFHEASPYWTPYHNDLYGSWFS